MTTKKGNNEFIDFFAATKKTREKMTFGSTIRSLRLCDEVSQVELAKKIGVSKQFLSDVEYNRLMLALNLLRRSLILLVTMWNI